MALVNDVASVGTGVGAAFAAYQLLLLRREATASFEQTFTARYESIVAQVPLELLLGESTTRNPQSERAFYDYFELCEEQLYYRAKGRISASTWADWCEGIALHLRRPAFVAAWLDLSNRAAVQPSSNDIAGLEQFTLLRSVLDDVAHGLARDPRGSWYHRLLRHGS